MLDKEKDINDLREKLKELKDIADASKIDLTSEINELRTKLDILSENLYINLTAWEKVCIARNQKRPGTLDYISAMFTDFIEMHGDRNFGDDAAIVGGIAMLGNIPVTVIGHQKGRNTAENVKRNFGMPHPEGYRKALRLMKQAEKFGRPVMCFIDTPGAYCGTGAEERGQGEAIARNLYEMSKLKVPIVSIIIGEGGSGGALALGVADQVWMLENSIYSILSPEGFASILWKDSSKNKEAAQVMKMTASDLKELGIIDRIIMEPKGGVHKDPEVVTASLKRKLLRIIPALQNKSLTYLIEDRYLKYKKVGNN